jgi:hypothetical protein
MPLTESADHTLPQKDAAMSAAAGANGANGANAGQPRGPDKSIANIYAQNQIWKDSKLDKDKDYFNKLGSGHAPNYMWIGKYNSTG